MGFGGFVGFVDDGGFFWVFVEVLVKIVVSSV